MQVKNLHSEFNKLQKLFGHSSLCAIYGAGCVRKPRAMFIFMNPTGRNISSDVKWKGLRAPWLGTKMIWQMFYDLGLISKDKFEKTQTFHPGEWTEVFADGIYKELEDSGVYITNLAKCTQVDARPLKDHIFKKYLDLMFREISFVNPKNVITLGNQVSSIVLGKPVSVSSYRGERGETLTVGNSEFNVYPVYYPVGQGRRNMPLAIKRIRKIIG